jgi:hypothetical protein
MSEQVIGNVSGLAPGGNRAVQIAGVPQDQTRLSAQREMQRCDIVGRGVNAPAGIGYFFVRASLLLPSASVD